MLGKTLRRRAIVFLGLVIVTAAWDAGMIWLLGRRTKDIHVFDELHLGRSRAATLLLVNRPSLSYAIALTAFSNMILALTCGSVAVNQFHRAHANAPACCDCCTSSAAGVARIVAVLGAVVAAEALAVAGILAWVMYEVLVVDAIYASYAGLHVGVAVLAAWLAGAARQLHAALRRQRGGHYRSEDEDGGITTHSITVATAYEDEEDGGTYGSITPPPPEEATTGALPVGGAPIARRVRRTRADGSDPMIMGQHSIGVARNARDISSDEFRIRLAAFYALHNIAKLAEVDALVHKFRGKELRMLAMLEHKYGAMVPQLNNYHGAIEFPAEGGGEGGGGGGNAGDLLFASSDDDDDTIEEGGDAHTLLNHPAAAAARR